MIGMPFYSPDELGAADLLTAVLTIALVLICLARARRRTDQRPIPRHALHRLNQRLNEQEQRQ